jgi:hypothetical protein
MNTNRLHIFENALHASKESLKKNPYLIVLDSVIKQLEFLIALERGETNDRQRLSTIIIGLITARDIHCVDKELAEMLYVVSNCVDDMQYE